MQTKTFAMLLLVAIATIGIATTVGMVTKHVLAASESSGSKGEGQEFGHFSSPTSFEHANSIIFFQHNGVMVGRMK
jgi:hypothetical protein